MTTQFKSFDRSPLGAFVKSPLGARNRPSILPTGNLHLAVIFIDEAQGIIGETEGYLGPFDGFPHLPSERWFADVARWEAARATHAEDSVGVAALVLQFPATFDPVPTWPRIWPRGTPPLGSPNLPLGVRIRQVNNEIDVPSWRQFFEEFVSNGVVEDVWFFLDRSGSLGLQDEIFRAIAPWVTELTDDGVRVFTRAFSDERWLFQAARV